MATRLHRWTDSTTTLLHLLGRSRRRDFVPISRSFLQDRNHRHPGPLAAFIRARRENALDLYLLAHALASAPPWDVAEYSLVWARALGISTPRSGAAVISDNWRWLEGQRLIRSERQGRQRRISLLAEDGSGRAYARPRSDFFKFPHSYWTFEWHVTLNLPAKAVLLIAHSLGDTFILPLDKVPNWYGLSADTAKRGTRALCEVGLLSYERRRKRAPRAPLGFTYERIYRLGSLTDLRPTHS